jgi:hypothetical protein
VLNNFSGIFIQVKNRSDHGVGDSETIHNSIQKLADEIFQAKGKRCVSLFVEFGEPKNGDIDGFQRKLDELNSHTTRMQKRLSELTTKKMEDTLRVSLFGVNRYSVKNARPGQYWYSDSELELLKNLVKFSSRFPGRHYVDKNDELFQKTLEPYELWDKRYKFEKRERNAG